MRILALDLGSSTGYALGHDKQFKVGTWVLESARGMRYAKKLRMDRRLDPRVMALLNNLTQTHLESPLDYLVYEDVLFSSSTAQTQLWSSFRGAVWAFAHFNGLQTECLNTASLKKFASGNGSAKKPDMARALARRDPRFRLDREEIVETLTGERLSTDAVDAAHLFLWALTILK